MKKVFLLLMAIGTAIAGMAKNDYYHLMTADSTIVDGDEIVFYCPTQKKASAGFYPTGKYLNGVTAQINEDGELVIEDSQPLTVKAHGNYWNLYLGKKSIGHKSTTDNSVDFASDVTTDFAITINADTNAIVKSQTGSTKFPQFYCNTNGNFRLYNSTTMSAIRIYRKVAQPITPVAVTSVTLNIHAQRVRVGEQFTLQATVLPEEAANKNITWTALQGNVSVDEGVVSALTEGPDTVIVTTEDGGFADTCAIEVVPAPKTLTWNQVQYVDSLKDGVRVFIGTEAKDVVVGLYEKGSNIKGVAATYSDNRHQVTASDEYAYTIQRDGEKIIFVGSDGKYLYMYNTSKNLSSSSTLDNKARWTITINERYGQALIANVYSSSWHIFLNKTAQPPLFCTYTTTPGTDANIANVCLYSDNAPAWKEYVPQPEWTILCGEDTIEDKLDFGKVVYDDSWGTEVNPYEAAKTLTFVTKDLEEQTINLSLKKGAVFELISSEVPGKGGTASIQFSTDSEGAYSDSLFVEIADTTIGILLTAEAVKEEEVKPTLSLSTHEIYLNPNLDNYMDDMAEFTFSVKNLVKPLYIKWEKGEIPDWQGDKITILAGNNADEVYFGSATNMGTETRTDESVLIEARAYETGTFVSTLCFYTYDANKELSFEDRVTITIHIDQEYRPVTGMEGLRNEEKGKRIEEIGLRKVVKEGRIMILRNGARYTIDGLKIDY